MSHFTSLERITRLLIAAALILGVTGCTLRVQAGSRQWGLTLGSNPAIQATDTPNPTYTPRPAFTPRPTLTPRPSYTPLPAITPE
jgi:hypothetical protein